MHPPDNIFFGVPLADRIIDINCAIAIFSAINKYHGQSSFLWGISEVSLARNILAHRFKKTDCEWIMMIDSDIVFTERDWLQLWESEEKIVFAPYAKKIPGARPAEFGLGFCRVHRSVFDAIDNLVNDDGREIVSQFYRDGEIHSHYFPVGVSGDSRWLGEDHAFFTLCAMTGIPYHREGNCSLKHVGPFEYGYPNQSNNAKFWEGVLIPPKADAYVESDDSDDSPDDYPEDDRPIVVM